MVLSSWEAIVNIHMVHLAMQTKHLMAPNPQAKLTNIHIHYHHLLLLNPKADTHFTFPRRVEG